MESEKITEIAWELKKISVGLSAMELSGNYKLRKHIHLSDEELQEYFKKVRQEIYTAFASNLILQQIFTEQLNDPETNKRYTETTQLLLDKLQEAGNFR